MSSSEVSVSSNSIPRHSVMDSLIHSLSDACMYASPSGQECITQTSGFYYASLFNAGSSPLRRFGKKDCAYALRLLKPIHDASMPIHDASMPVHDASMPIIVIIIITIIIIIIHLSRPVDESNDRFGKHPFPSQAASPRDSYDALRGQTKSEQ